tara:strand:- start:2120 stop:2377 length:258 start_codon:yes stop_codon:yes gene_type:complete
MSKRRKAHVATGMDAQELLGFVTLKQGVTEDDAIFHIAQSLSFLIQGSTVSDLKRGMSHPKNKFAIRKLKACLRTLDIVQGDLDD